MSAERLLLTLLLAAVKAGVLLALAAGIAAGLRRAPARARHGVWAVALAGALLVPLMAPWVPDWSIAALRLPRLAAGWTAEVVEPASPPAAPVSDPIPPDRVPAARVPAAGAAVPSPDRPPGRRDAGPALPASRVAAAIWQRLTSLPAAGWLLALWLAGCLASAASFLRALAAARRLGRRAAAAGPSWRPRLEAASRRAGVRREVRLLLSDEAATPITWGWLRPVVVLPAAAGRWSAERRRVVLLHELSHVRRADWLLRLLARLVCSVYWFNPLAWAAARRLAVEQEIACDEEVVALGTRPSVYAGHLLAIARAAGATRRAPALALDMARDSQMEGRLMSILDGGRRPSGGRPLAILALALIAGLVPALAAIEPWVEEREDPAMPATGRQGGGDTGLSAEEVARALDELAEVEREMEPFQAELESLAAEIEPIEEELAGIEAEMEPVVSELEGVAAEIEPYDEMIAAVEAEMEPIQARLEAVEVELGPFERMLEQVEVELAPHRERLEAIEVEMEPFQAELEAIEVELEPLQEALERLSEQARPLASDGARNAEELERLNLEMEDVSRRMEPLFERMRATHERLEPLFERMSAAHGDMEPLYERMQAIHQEMAPVYERLGALHEELEPSFERLSQIHERMAPIHQRLGAANERLAPYHQRMGERHEAMAPYHRKMGEIHERMEPLHQEMGRRHRQLERELTGLVERMLAVELGGVTAADTDYAPVAARIVDAVSLRVEDGTLRISSSPPELRGILEEELGGRITSSAEEFAAAVDRFVRALGELEIEAS